MSYLAEEDYRSTPKSPLDPCVCPRHSDMYAIVDNTLVEYENYLEYINSFKNTPNGFCSLFQGETGSGKTSLINRCLKQYSEINWVLNKETIQPYIVDLRKEVFTNSSISEKAENVYEYIIDNLISNPIVSSLDKFNNESQAIEKKVINIRLKFLERVFNKYKKQLVILFPKIELREEITSIMDLYYRSNWVIFIETDNPSILAYCNKNHKKSSHKPINCHKLGVLNPDDAKSFIESRLKYLDSNIKFHIPDLKRYIESTLKRPWGGAGVLELELICHQAYEYAKKEGIELIKFEHLAEAAISQFTVLQK